MSEKVDIFIQELERCLKELPAEEINDAIQYYREYLSDAIESGLDEDEVIEQLGLVEKIAESIRLEASFERARENPGLKNYGGVLKNTFHMLTTPFSVLFLSLFTLLSYGIVAVLFAGAACVLLGAFAVLFVLIHEMTKMNAAFFMEMIGTLGMGLMVSGLMVFLAGSLYRTGILFIRLSVWMIEKMQKKPVGKRDTIKRQQEKGQARFKKPTLVLSAVSLAGLILFLVSGLPFQYFKIFNSMPPANIQFQSHRFETEETQQLSIVTAHSKVIITEGTGDKIQFLYDKPAYMEADVKIEGNTLYFRETSAGKLPFFELVSLHESLTTLEVIIPKGFDVDMIRIESTGGHISISGIAQNIQAKTMNGRIEVEKNLSPSVSIIAQTNSGKIFTEGHPVGQKTDKTTEYRATGQTDKTMRLISTRGEIHLK